MARSYPKKAKCFYGGSDEIYLNGGWTHVDRVEIVRYAGKETVRIFHSYTQAYIASDGEYKYRYRARR